MKRRFIPVILKCVLLLLPVMNLKTPVHAQESYWQQEVNYTIDVSLNTARHSLHGAETVTYTNNSPDTLQFIWFHVWPNAYKNNSTAWYRQLMQSKDRSEKLRRFRDRGYIDSLQFTVNGQPAVAEPDKDNPDMVKLLLNNKLLPNQQITIATPFYVKLPSYVSRSGYADGMFMITQWYPKPAVYDKYGWHPMPYLDQGEFYSEFGSFTVNITVPSAFVVAATGSLLDSIELSRYKQSGSENYRSANKVTAGKINQTKYAAVSGSHLKTLKYFGKDIHDFAWFASKDMIIQYDTLLLPSGNIIDVFSFYQPGRNTEWAKSLGFIEDAVNKYSKWVGEYPYPVVNAVEGPANIFSGGMEYPMVTLITSPGATAERLDAVITHEVGHNWFYGILGTNERDHAWMDEGINTYYQFRYEAEKYKSNSYLGNAIPSAMQQRSTEEFLALLYHSFTDFSITMPVETPSNQFDQAGDYTLTVYIKAAMWMYITELTIGKNILDKAMRDFFTEWQFKHPYPDNFKASLEKSTNMGMTNIFNLLYKKGVFK